MRKQLLRLIPALGLTYGCATAPELKVDEIPRPPEYETIEGYRMHISVAMTARTIADGALRDTNTDDSEHRKGVFHAIFSLSDKNKDGIINDVEGLFLGLPPPLMKHNPHWKE